MKNNWFVGNILDKEVVKKFDELRKRDGRSRKTHLEWLIREYVKKST